jgi:hypothetical protein
MVVITHNDRIKAARQEKLMPIMARHRHACLTCAQQEGCPRSQCSANVPENERCCPQFGHCELQNVANYVGLPDATPKWVPTDLALLEDHPLFERDYNFCPEFSDKKECIWVDQVILAVGQATDLSFLADNSPVKVNGGLVVVDEDTLETGMPGVYAGGDIAKARGAVIHAVAAGRLAAASIDRTLGGSGDIDEVLFPRSNPDPFLGRDEGFASFPRENIPELDVETRIKGFQEIAVGYSAETAVKEAARCLQCDLRFVICGCI